MSREQLALASLLLFGAGAFIFSRRALAGEAPAAGDAPGVTAGSSVTDGAWSWIDSFGDELFNGELFGEGYSMSGGMTRGERNNNPGNIEKSGTAWRGKVAGSDPRFETFASPEYGIRAMAVTLRTYFNRYDLDTVAKIIDRWAPPVENDTRAYVRQVARALDVGADEPIDVNDEATLRKLVAAIITHENGRNIYGEQQLVAAVSDALGGTALA